MSRPRERESKKASKLKSLKYLTLFISCFALSFITGSLTFIPQNSAAETASTENEITLTLSSIIALTLSPSSLELDLTPTPSGTEQSGTIEANVSTNNPTGYTLTMKTLTANTALTHTNATNTIPSNNNSQAAPLPVNTWGYSLDASSSYLPIPSLTTEATLTTTNAPVANDQTTVTIGTKIDTTTTAGTYSNTLQFTAVTNYVPLPEAPTGTAMQLVGADYSCPTTRTRLVDARDNATYWIQKLADGKCWMLTNLAYAGGGTNTYNDVKTITLNSTNTGATFTSPEYYIPPGANRTVEPQDPSTSTTGTGQYGYLYNWCAAMGVQTGTSACMNATTPTPNQNISICPSGWRLPTGPIGGGEYGMLVWEVNGGPVDDTALRYWWLGMYSGDWHNGFFSQGTTGEYLTSTQGDSASMSHAFTFNSDELNYSNLTNKSSGGAVRCVTL